MGKVPSSRSKFVLKSKCIASGESREQHQNILGSLLMSNGDAEWCTGVTALSCDCFCSILRTCIQSKTTKLGVFSGGFGAGYFAL